MSKQIAPGFKSPDQVEAFLRMTFKPGTSFKGERFKNVTDLVKSFQDLYRLSPERAGRAVAIFATERMKEFLQGEGTPEATLGHKNSSKNTPRRSEESSDELFERIQKLVRHSISWAELQKLLSEFEVKPSGLLWRVSAAKTKQIVNRHDVHKRTEFEIAAAEREAQKSPQLRMQNLVSTKSKSGWDVDAAILGVASLCASRPDIKGLVAELAKWDREGLNVDSDYLDQLAATTSRQLAEFLEEDNLALLQSLKSAKYIRVGRLPLSKQLACIDTTRTKPGFGDLSPARQVMKIQTAIDSELQVIAAASTRTPGNQPRCPICGQTPCARGSQCFNED